MRRDTYLLLENYMLSCMDDSAHDKEHIYRVLYNALDIAQTEENVDYDILICACLLHDIGRKEQLENSGVCHAAAGAEKASRFLREHGFSEVFTQKVCACIRSHRYRKDNPPQSIEAKILFDADKIDVSGAVGIARTLAYKGQLGEPLYSLKPDGQVSDGEDDRTPSFFQEYKYKLENLYEHFLTSRGAELAGKRQQAAAAFYNSMLQEITKTYENGAANLGRHLEWELTEGAPIDKDGRLQKELAVYELLEELEIEFWRIDHPAAMTMEDCEAVDKKLDTVMCKNLFLCNAQKTNFYLLLMPAHKKFKTKDLSKQIGSARLSFGDAEHMEQYLNIWPGAVSVMGLMNDRENRVRLLIDQELLKEEWFACHPCVNTSSLRMKLSDVLEKFLPAVHHDFRSVELPAPEE